MGNLTVLVYEGSFLCAFFSPASFQRVLGRYIRLHQCTQDFVFLNFYVKFLSPIPSKRHINTTPSPPATAPQHTMASSPNQPPNAEGFDTRQGTLIEFSNNPWRRLSAFRCGTHSRALIVIGGVTDTFFSLNYIDCLTESMVQAAGYSVVQPLFSSWFAGYEESTLANDTEELDGLMVKLAASGVTEVALLGHGTGAQDCMHYLSVGNHAHMVNRLILQGGIQDPEAGDLSYEMKQNYRDEAVRLIRAGRGNSLMPAEAHPLPVSAFRYMALGGRHSASDFFNPTQPLDDMQLVLGHITVPCLVLFCLTDKYCPSGERRQEIMDKVRRSPPFFLEKTPFLCLSEHPITDTRVHTSRCTLLMAQRSMR